MFDVPVDVAAVIEHNDPKPVSLFDAIPAPRITILYLKSNPYSLLVLNFLPSICYMF